MAAKAESSADGKYQHGEKENKSDRIVTVGELSASISYASLQELIIDEKTALESIATLLTQLQEKAFTNSTLPLSIREGKGQIENPKHLAKALIPANNKYLAEGLTNFTKAQITRISEKAFATKSPINISIDLPSFNIHDAQIDGAPDPNFFDYLFLKQIKDYLQVLNSYPYGINLTFTFDNSGESWVFNQILNQNKISETQSAHIKIISELICKLFSKEDFPELNIQVGSEDEDATTELESSLSQYEKLEAIIIEKSIEYFKKIKEAKKVDLNWVDIFRQTQDPHYGHTMFYDMQRVFINEYIHELDPDSELEFFRPTPKEISSIAQKLQAQFKKEFYESDTQSSIPTSGYIQYEVIKEIAKRFIARELLLNKQRQVDRDTIHIVPGDPSLYKSLFRRRVIALKPSGVDIIAHSQYSKPKIDLSPQNLQIFAIDSTTENQRSDDPYLTIRTPHGDFEINLVR